MVGSLESYDFRLVEIDRRYMFQEEFKEQDYWNYMCNKAIKKHYMRKIEGKIFAGNVEKLLIQHTCGRNDRYIQTNDQ